MGSKDGSVRRLTSKDEVSAMKQQMEAFFGSQPLPKRYYWADSISKHSSARASHVHRNTRVCWVHLTVIAFYKAILHQTDLSSRILWSFSALYFPLIFIFQNISMFLCAALTRGVNNSLVVLTNAPVMSVILAMLSIPKTSALLRCFT